MLVTIPSNYEEQNVAPICINDTDDRGRPVVSGWIDAVRPIAGELRSIVRRITGDVWHVSEVTEQSVHVLSAKHGIDLGPHPDRAIRTHVRYRARDLVAGSRRLRAGLEVELKEQVLECLSNPQDHAAVFETRDLIEKLEARLDEMELPDVKLMLNLYLSEAEDQLPFLFPQSTRERNRLRQRFRRGLQRALKLIE